MEFGFKPGIIKVVGGGWVWSLAEGCGVSVGTYIPVIAKAVRAL